MMGLRSRGLATLVLVVSAAALAACRSQESGRAPRYGGASAAQGASLLASVPADTPYLLASLDAVPIEYYARFNQALGPLLEQAVRSLGATSGDDKVLGAILSELDGKWSQAGLESLGFSAQPRLAIYGLGLQPVVLRLTVKDGRAVQATIERIAARAGKTLPAMATRAGRRYWQVVSSGGTAVVVALADRQLIAAIGTSAEVEAKLGLILGIDRPAQTLADGTLVKEVMARHGFGAQLIGFADTLRIVRTAIEASGAQLPAACSREIERLSGKIPRVALGYSELSASRASGGMVLELSPDWLAEVRALKTEVPGLAAAMSGAPMMAIGGGLDLARGQQLALAVAGSMEQLGVACGQSELIDGAGEMSRALSRPLPEPAGRISGGVFALEALEFDGPQHEPKLDSLQGVALIASPDPRGLLDKVLELVPLARTLGIAADGKLHDVGGIALPFLPAISAGVGDRAIVVTAGGKQKALGVQLLGARGGGQAPLLAMSYDVGKLIDLGMKIEDEDPGPEMRAAMRALASLFGQVSATVDVTPNGLAFWSTVEMK